MDFALVKQGETEPIVEVAHSEIYTSNVNAEVELEAGTYLVYVRLNRQLTNRVRFVLLSPLSHSYMILACDNLGPWVGTKESLENYDATCQESIDCSQYVSFAANVSWGSTWRFLPDFNDKYGFFSPEYFTIQLTSV